jgi:hypothetical protein
VHVTTVAKSGADTFIVDPYAGAGELRSGDTVTTSAVNSVSSFVVATAPDSVALVGRIEGPWTAAETNALQIRYYIADATNYVRVFTTGAARHKGVWNNAAHRVEVTNTTPLGIYVRETVVDGLQLSVCSTNANCSGLAGTAFAAGMNTGNVWIVNTIVRGLVTNANGNYRGIYWNPGGALTGCVVNCVLYGFHYTNVAAGVPALFGDQTAYPLVAYNCTVSDCDYGLRVGKAVNCVAFDNGKDFYGVSPAYPFHCASDDGNGSNAVKWTNGVADWSKVFVDFDNCDFRLSAFAGDAASIIDKGIDNPLGLFPRDIAGTPRVSPWDIGAFEYFPLLPSGAILSVR